VIAVVGAWLLTSVAVSLLVARFIDAGSGK